MLPAEREKVRKAAEAGAYMSVAVNSDGTPVRGGFVPWEGTSNAFNMKTPKATLAAADLQDAALMEDLRTCNLCGLYLFVPLEDYAFISSFRRLRDVFICHGQNVRSLSFLSGLTDLFLFYLEDAAVPDLEPLVEVFQNGSRFPAKCMGFYHCRVEDPSALGRAGFLTSELLVWPVEGDTRERWRFPALNPGRFRFYPYS